MNTFLLTLIFVAVVGIFYAVKSSINTKKANKIANQRMEVRRAASKRFVDNISDSDKSIYFKLKKTGKVEISDGVLFILSNGRSVIMAITKTMICPNPQKFPNMLPISTKSGILKGTYEVMPTSLTDVVTINKKASVGGRAVAGAAVAGTAGAVVGAATAVSKNANGGITKTKTYNSSASKQLFVLDLNAEVNNVKISKKVGKPPHLSELRNWDWDDCYELAFDTLMHSCSYEMATEILSFINQKLVEK